MVKKRILIILANTKKESFCRALADSYEQGANSKGHDIKRINLGDLKFNPILDEDSTKKQPLEQDLIKSQKLIKWANHIVFIYPIWWSALPAILKGFIDRTFISGFAYKYHRNKMMPEQLLKEKSARLFATMDAPPIIYAFWFGIPGNKIMKRGLLNFCGISPVRISNIGALKTSTESKRKKWLRQARQLGEKGI